MDSKELRDKFIKFFESKGHKLVAPASLIPENDPSVLFTTAGMQQFKRFYTNPEEALEKFGTKNVVTCQLCLRTSDIDEVGDETHLTFFEMLGNFSFGGYGKKEAIEWGYEFLTKILKIDSSRIKCSIFGGDDKNPHDKESSDILENIGILFEEHGREDNFWGPTGNEGPCGPTVEFYIDGIEVWNLVFNEYFQNADGLYRKLETPGVDTGMGLERMLVVLNKKSDVYQTDLFWPIIQEIEKLTDMEYGPKADKEYIEDDKQCWVDVRKQFRIIADHLKSTTFLLADEIIPDKIGRGYITRRLIRRSIIQSKKLKIKSKISELIKSVFEIYPNIQKGNILSEFEKESTKFDQTLERGLREFEKVKLIDGETAFRLFETYGFPIELTEELAKEKNIEIDVKEFEEAQKKHQEVSRAGVTGFKSGLVGESPITTRMHTATHLLLKALQEVLAPAVHQRGSNINEERIRFDFSYPVALTEDEIKRVEGIVNKMIEKNMPVVCKETTVEEAKKLGAEAQFIEKYSQYGKLTMYSIDDYSHELCGGPHVKSTGEIGKFKIIKEESSSSGVRRIRAVLE